MDFKLIPTGKKFKKSLFCEYGGYLTDLVKRQRNHNNQKNVFE